jgi:hypothetical protein
MLTILSYALAYAKADNKFEVWYSVNHVSGSL